MFAARVNLRYIPLPCVGLPLAIPFKSWPPLATINLQLHVQNASTPVIARCNKLKVASGAGWKGEPQPHALAQRQSVPSVAGSWSFCKIPTTTGQACELLARPLLHEVKRMPLWLDQSCALSLCWDSPISRAMLHCAVLQSNGVRGMPRTMLGVGFKMEGEER